MQLTELNGGLFSRRSLMLTMHDHSAAEIEEAHDAFAAGQGQKIESWVALQLCGQFPI